MKPRKKFDPEEHRRWREEVWGDETFDTLTPLMESREDRVLIYESALAALTARDEKEQLAARKPKSDQKPCDNF